ncbi:MAG: hypothetical protein C0393_05735 [Anaerolinea sp.]|nr:hypothetical protein [Anaerolinea sp.]
MMPDKLSKRVISDRLAWVDAMLAEIHTLPLGSREAFFADRRNIHTAESCLRRALESLFDIGRHTLAKGFAHGVSEYKEIAQALKMHGVITPEIADTMRILAGYRNRMVHFYHEISPDELYEICATSLKDVERVAGAFRKWIHTHPEQIDKSL